MRHIHRIAALCAFVAATAWAGDIKPGLWETEIPGVAAPASSNKMAEALKNMSPQERQQMEAMLGNLGVGVGKANTIRVCLTPEQVKSRDSAYTPEPGCSHKIVEQSAKTMKVQFKCADSEGTASTVFHSSEGYDTTIDSTTVIDGKKQRVQQTIKSRWVGANCGAVKPMAPPAAKR